MDTVHWFLSSAVVALALALSVVAFKHRKGSGTYLCDDCRFNDATKCLKTERPYAFECTSYRPIKAPEKISGES